MKAAAILMLLALAGCDMGDEEAPVIDRERGLDLIGLGFPLNGEKEGRTYIVYDAFRDADAAKRGAERFHEFECAGSCADVKAGFEQAASNRLTEPRQCDGPNWAAVEGCAAYLLTLPTGAALKAKAERMMREQPGG